MLSLFPPLLLTLFFAPGTVHWEDLHQPHASHVSPHVCRSNNTEILQIRSCQIKVFREPTQVSERGQLKTRWRPDLHVEMHSIIPTVCDLKLSKCLMVSAVVGGVGVTSDVDPGEKSHGHARIGKSKRLP